MPVHVCVAVHVNRGTAIRAGRNCWGWITTMIDLEELSNSERDALARCPEHEGVLRLTHSRDFALSELAELFLSEEGLDKVDQATPETARVVIRDLVERSKAAHDEAVAAAENVFSKADEEIAELKAWLRMSPAELVQEIAGEHFPDTRFISTRGPVSPRETRQWESIFIPVSAYSTEQSSIVEQAIHEARDRLEGAWNEHQADVEAHQVAVRAEVERRRQIFDKERREAQHRRFEWSDRPHNLVKRPWKQTH